MAVSISPGEFVSPLDASTLDAINAVNLVVGELALALDPDDPRRDALFCVQGGLDVLSRELTLVAS